MMNLKKGSYSLLVKSLFWVPFLVGLVGACTQTSKNIDGYVGIDSEGRGGAASGGSSTPTSSLIAMAAAQTSYDINEGETKDIVVSFNRKIPRDSSIHWQIDNAASDIDVISGNIPLVLEDDKLTISLTVKTDAVYEGKESFQLKLIGESTLFMSTLIVPIKIIESLPKPVVSLDTLQLDVNENDGTIDLPVHLSQASSQLINVSFSIQGSATPNKVDYWITPSPALAFNPGVTTGTLQVHLVDDLLLESFEDIQIELTNISVGDALIDATNKTTSLSVKDNDALSLFFVQGVTGASDIQKDSYLTSGNVATVYWTAVPSATEFKARLLTASDSPFCGPFTVGPNVQSFTFDTCTLNEGTTYKAQVDVTTSDGITGPSNTVTLPFSVDTIVPPNFEIIGVMGKPDTSPDDFLAGTTKPTIVWTDSTGENQYRIAIIAATSSTVICPEVTVPANVTAYSFDACTLTEGVAYRVEAKAIDAAGNSVLATNNLKEFRVTEVPGGYIIKGVKGGISDTLANTDMTDGLNPIIEWDSTQGTTQFTVALYNVDGTIRCSANDLPGNVFTVTLTNCDLKLHDDYDVRVTAKDGNNLEYPAANSPYRFKYKVGLFISGIPSEKSYFRGVTINNCGGTDGSLCDATTPFVISENFFESQIRVSSNGVLAGVPYNPALGAPSPSNGLLKIQADYLKIDGGKISMEGRGYPQGQGPGQGTNGNPASGASHGGLSYPVSGNNAVNSYGVTKLPVTPGSGGGSNGVLYGGAGGGVIDITVNEDLTFFNGFVSATGAAPLVSATNAGGGSGGSLIVRTKRLLGTGSNFVSNGGAGNGTGTPGAGGRLALYYQENLIPGDILGVKFSAVGGAHGNFRGASGTIFYKKSTDALGYLVTDNPQHTEGIETPIDLVETFDNIITKSYGTFIVQSSDAYTLPLNTLNFRLVVAGDFSLPLGENHFTVGPTGYLEWRRTSAMNQPKQWDQLTVDYGGVITHTSINGSGTPSYVLELTNFTTIDLKGRLDATGKGYPSGTGPGSATGSYGASYGGLGGIIATGTRNLTYGRSVDADKHGSGGGAGDGGGYIKITKGSASTELILKGTIKAAGIGACGGGSGGSIFIDVAKISGSGGQLSVLGGDGLDCGAGGGGRIALYYNEDAFPGGLRNFSYQTYGGNGGTNGRDGAAGTVFLKSSDPLLPDSVGHLIAYNSSRRYEESATTLLTPFDENLLFDSITTDASATLHLPATYTTFQISTPAIDFRLVNEGHFSFPGTHLSIAYGGYLEWRQLSPLTVNSLTIDAGGELSHTHNGATKNYIVSLNISNNLVINGKINADGRGYAQNQGPGLPPAVWGGAGHGGRGGIGANRSNTNPGSAYGADAVKWPDELGSGTRNNSTTPGASGGGLVDITVGGTLTMNGTISAEGAEGACTSTGYYCTAGGSGGSIRISTNIVDGSGGTISTNGGNGPIGASGNKNLNGGGGRIAIIYNQDDIPEGQLLSRINNQRLRATGGDTLDDRSGAAGSIFLQQGATLGTVYYHNGNNPHYQKSETPVSPNLTFDNTITLGNAFLIVPSGTTYTLPSTNLTQKLVVEGTLNYTLPYSLVLKSGSFLEWRKKTDFQLTNLTMETGSILTHSYNLAAEDYKLFLVIDDKLDLQGGSVISVDDRGMQAGARPASATGSQGGGLGGAGAYGGSTVAYQPYGDYAHPIDLGSGGASCAGAGMIHITVGGETLLNGRISASAATCTFSSGAPGSGGSIYIDGNILKGGTALVMANGAYGNSEGSGGGRIAILYNSDLYGLANLYAVAIGGNRGSGTGVDGGAGTIYYKNKMSGYDQLIVKNTGRTADERVWTKLPSGSSIQNIQVDNTARIFIANGTSVNLPSSHIGFYLIIEGSGNPILPGAETTLTILNQGTLELRGNKTTPFPPPASTITKLVVLNGGTLTHTSHDYTGAVDTYSAFIHIQNMDLFGTIQTSGKGHTTLLGPGAGATVASFVGSGGSHGGIGNRGSVATTSNPNDSVTNPVLLGSGGGGGSCPAYSSTGGGRVRLEIENELNLSGKIYSDGEYGLSACGGGSGGTINILTNTLKGSGAVLQARGGPANTGGGSGGGGRISLTYVNDLYSGGAKNISFRLEGGVGSGLPGGAGTAFINSTAAIPFTDPYPLYPSTDLQGSLIINNGTLTYQTGSEAYVNQSFTFNEATGDTLDIASNTSGLYIPTGVTLAFNSSNLNFPLRLRGDAQFPSDNLVIKSGGILTVDHNNVVTFNSLQMEPGGLITHSLIGTAPMTRALRLKVLGDMAIAANSKINVSGLGYTTGQGPGSAADSVKSGPGGSHGGRGGGNLVVSTVTYIPPSGNIYPSASTLPTQAGSGGGSGDNDKAPGGTGGGFVELEVLGTLTLDGMILADGNPVSAATRRLVAGYNHCGGGGAGGGVVVKADRLIGFNGMISATGGNVDTSGGCIYCGGGGGGGRIYLQYNEKNLLNFSYSLSGGFGVRQGFDGTYEEIPSYP